MYIKFCRGCGAKAPHFRKHTCLECGAIHQWREPTLEEAVLHRKEEQRLKDNFEALMRYQWESMVKRGGQNG